MAICNIEDKRARDRAKEKGLPANKRRAAGRLMIEGAVTTNWKRALSNSHHLPRTNQPTPLNRTPDRLTQTT